jgi:hypothetical protein
MKGLDDEKFNSQNVHNWGGDRGTGQLLIADICVPQWLVRQSMQARPW